MKRLINQIATLTVFLAVAGLASCSKSIPSEDPQPDGIRLELTAALDGGFGAAPSDATNGTTKAPVFGSIFPAGTYQLSLAVFKENKTEAWAPGYENIKAEVTVNSFGTQSWRFQINSIWMSYLAFPDGTVGNMWITAIYPYDASMTLSAITGDATLSYNLDLTTTAQQASQSDIMVAKPQKLTVVSSDRSKALLLSFTHIFSLFEFQIAPIFNDPCKITKIALYNGTSETWVSNKGTIRSNGDYTATNHGEVAITSELAMTMGAYNTYQIMLPTSSLNFDNYGDGDITVRFTDATSTVVEPLPLPIKREWLMPSGLKSGNRYSFRLIYHNAATGSSGMTVTDWAINEPIDEFWGVPPFNEGYLYFDNSAIVTSGTFISTAVTITNPTTAPYNGYNADGVNNGGLFADLTSVIGELPYYRFEVAATNEVALAWADAWAACKAKLPAGKWRLPRTTELMLIKLNKTELETTPGFTAMSNAIYWAGTEHSESNAWAVHMSTTDCKGKPKSESTFARCVREL